MMKGQMIKTVEQINASEKAVIAAKLTFMLSLTAGMCFKTDVKSNNNVDFYQIKEGTKHEKVRAVVITYDKVSWTWLEFNDFSKLMEITNTEYDERLVRFMNV